MLLLLYTLYRWASLTDSAVFLSGSKLGDAVGFISSNIASTGDAAYFTLYTLVNDGSESEQIYTNNTIKWYSDETWTQTGSMYATTAFRLVNSVNWDALGSFTYGDNEYMLHAQDAYANGDEVFLAHAMGGYGGTWTNWYVLMFLFIFALYCDLHFVLCWILGLLRSQNHICTSVGLSLVMWWAMLALWYPVLVMRQRCLSMHW